MADVSHEGVHFSAQRAKPSHEVAANEPSRSRYPGVPALNASPQVAGVHSEVWMRALGHAIDHSLQSSKTHERSAGPPLFGLFWTRGRRGLRLATAPMSSVSISEFLAQSPELIRAQLPAFLSGYIAPDSDHGEVVQRSIERALESVSSQEWADLLELYGSLGQDYGSQPSHPLARELLLAFVQPLIGEGSDLTGLEHLDAAMAAIHAGRRVLLICNHLSYADTICTYGLLERMGRLDALGRLCTVAGPKVYADPMRRMGIAGGHSISVAQSSRLATNEVVLSPRESVKIARRCFNDAASEMDQGQLVLLYPEGTRSRTGHQGPFFRGVARWVTIDGVLLLPLGQWGGETIDRLSDDWMRPGVVCGRFGPLLDTRALVGEQGMSREAVLEACHEAVAALLPPNYGPVAEAPRLV